MKMTPAMQRTRDFIESKLLEIEPLFIDGTKFTFLARVPSIADADMIVTNEESIKDAIKALEFLRFKDEQSQRSSPMGSDKAERG